MELQLKNIGMIKEANVKIDGLTVIAGENDTGKSTVGKALFMTLEFIKQALIKPKNINKQIIESKQKFILPKLIFDSQISGAKIDLNYNENKIALSVDINHNLQTRYKEFKFSLNKEEILLPIIIETPLVWNLNKFFNQMANIQSQASMFGDELSIDYPFLLKDLHFKLMVGINKKSYKIEDKILTLINGKFKRDELSNYYFERKKKKISLLNTATGIKYFGIFQILSQNNYLNKNTVLLLDEPEVHLHPKWQLEMAKIIVELVKNGVKIVVNSHSPYMIQALIKYARDKDIVDKSNFYLSEKVDDYAVINNVNEELNKIFELLAEPMNEVFEL